jgi:hypothetical protein
VAVKEVIFGAVVLAGTTPVDLGTGRDLAIPVALEP